MIDPRKVEPNEGYRKANSKEQLYLIFDSYDKKQLINYTIELEFMLADVLGVLDKTTTLMEAIQNGSKSKESTHRKVAKKQEPASPQSPSPQG